MFHIYQVPFADNTERVGYERPQHAICMTPNICRSQARGKVSLASADPKDKPCWTSSTLKIRTTTTSVSSSKASNGHARSLNKAHSKNI